MLAGPYATRILADFGAEVIKVQSKKTAKGAESNLSGYFNMWNRNKRSITLDMSFPEAKEIVLELTKISNVLVENFSPRVMSNWGLTYEKLKEAKADLIMVSLSAFGQTGPWKDLVAFGPTVQALSGFTFLTSYPQGPPMGLGYAYADPVAGLYAAFAILAALEHRDRKGQGQYIDLSEYEAMCSLLGPTFGDICANQTEVLPPGNRPENLRAAPYGCFRCSGTDRWCVIAVFDQSEWQALCRVLDHPDWTEDKRFSTFECRKKNEEALDQLLGQWTVQHSSGEVVHLLQEAGVPSGVVQDAEDLAKDPQLLARNFFIHLKHPVLGCTTSDRSPIRMSDRSTAGWKAAPLLGEDNRYVYMELLGMKEQEFSSYVERGIIA